MKTPTAMKHLRSLLPDDLYFRDSSSSAVCSMFASLYKCYIRHDYESLAYPKGFDLELEEIPVCVMFHETEDGHDIWFILQTHIHPKTEMLMASESDSIRVYHNRAKDAFSYVARFSGVILA